MSAIIEPDKDNFRDRITTVEDDGSRKWIFAKKPHGFFYNLRSASSIFYLIIFFGLPWIQYKGQPFFMLNVVQRKFIIFGLHFGVQDLIVFGLAMLTFVVFVVLFTVVFGRLFCGWACPQTIFMEMVFRKIEYWIDGDAQQQRNLKKSDWTQQKIIKRVVKYLAFIIVSFAISNTFLAYIIGLPELKKIITEPVSMHILGFMALIIFTGAFFAVYAFAREQICLVACPYGRLQGVMLDKNSIVVAYDYVRGEPRGKMQKAHHHAEPKHDDGSKCTGKCEGCKVIHEPAPEPPKFGDCIDCKACVVVCPTGIDIRNGTQLECINCTACIDACDDIMIKIDKPKGLIRYASDNQISKGEKFRFGKRLTAYSIVLLALLVLLAFTFVSHSVVDASVLRTPGQFYQENPDGTISNLYNFEVFNKESTTMQLKFVLDDHEGSIKIIGNENISIPPGEERRGQLFIIMPRASVHEKKSQLEIKVYDGPKKLKTINTTFMAPVD
ncbi:MAG: cytochrome c oxidase accessory protein CcoG [Chitinophagaceae bacterium]|nr:cytochrome c oxidase accessory protein CcoG [Chitinophagaceae bacterium]